MIQSDGPTSLYIAADEGELTGAQARQVAAELLNGADQLDAVTR